MTPPSIATVRLRASLRIRSRVTGEGQRQDDRQADVTIVQCLAASLLVEMANPWPDLRFGLRAQAKTRLSRRLDLPSDGMDVAEHFVPDAVVAEPSAET